jgi:uncharacterized protein YeaO (DUF488 family)
VCKERYVAGNWVDVWYPALSPLVSNALAAKTESDGKVVVRSFHKEMEEPRARRTCDLLAGPSYHGHFSIGCYCEDEACCHRAMLRQFRSECGANVA